MQLRITIFSVVSFLSLLTAQNIQAQISDTSYNGVNDPFSFYGLGSLQYDGLQNGWMMGHTGVVTNNSVSPNVVNPASLSHLRLTSLDFSLQGVSSRASTQNNAVSSGNFTPVYFNLAMPVGKKGGFSLGMNQRFTSLYRIRDEYEVQIGDSMLNVREELRGKGSINNIRVAGGYKTKHLSFGSTINFNFGNRTEQNDLSFPDSTEMLSTEYYRNWVTSGFTFQFGAQYFTTLSDSNHMITLGAVYGLGGPIKVTEENVARSYFDFTRRIYIDSTTARNELNGDIIMPSNYRFGLGYTFNNRFTVQLDYTIVDFKKTSYIGRNLNLGNFSQLSFGTSFTPTLDFRAKALSRANYALGFYTTNDYYKANNNDVQSWGITGGISYPLLRNLGMVHFGVEYNNKGNASRNLAEMRNTIFRLGVTFSDIWFQKRYYD